MRTRLGGEIERIGLTMKCELCDSDGFHCVILDERTGVKEEHWFCAKHSQYDPNASPALPKEYVAACLDELASVREQIQRTNQLPTDLSFATVEQALKKIDLTIDFIKQNDRLPSDAEGKAMNKLIWPQFYL